MALKSKNTESSGSDVPFAHAGWALLCLSTQNGTCRVAARAYTYQTIEGTHRHYQQNHPGTRSRYVICRDLTGVFGAEGTLITLEALTPEQWELLQLNPAQFLGGRSGKNKS